MPYYHSPLCIIVLLTIYNYLYTLSKRGYNPQIFLLNYCYSFPTFFISLNNPSKIYSDLPTSIISSVSIYSMSKVDNFSNASSIIFVFFLIFLLFFYFTYIIILIFSTVVKTFLYDTCFLFFLDVL